VHPNGAAHSTRPGKQSVAVDQIFEVRADGLLVPKVMVLFQQAIKQRLLGGAPYQLKLEWTQLAELACDGRAIEQQGCGPGSSRQWIVSHIAHRRQLDFSSTLELYQ
jgi:hypothetical protein